MNRSGFYGGSGVWFSSPGWGGLVVSVERCPARGRARSRPRRRPESGWDRHERRTSRRPRGRRVRQPRRTAQKGRRRPGGHRGAKKRRRVRGHAPHLRMGLRAGRHSRGDRKTRLHRHPHARAPQVPQGQSRQGDKAEGVRHPHRQNLPRCLLRLPPRRHGPHSRRCGLQQHLGQTMVGEAPQPVSPTTRRRPPGRRRRHRQEKPRSRSEAQNSEHDRNRTEDRKRRAAAQQTAEHPWHGPNDRQRRTRAVSCDDRARGTLTVGSTGAQHCSERRGQTYVYPKRNGWAFGAPAAAPTWCSSDHPCLRGR